MPKFQQFDFRGGMNLFHLDHAIGLDEYGYGFNLRIRDNSISGIPGPLEDTSVPIGKKQALYGFDEYLILANGGRLYYLNTSDSEATWTIISNVLLSASADRIYMQSVPATPKLFKRVLVGSNISGTSSASNITVTNEIVVNGFPSGIVVQDGTTQPYFVYRGINTLIAYKIKNYSQWTPTNREYVPVGKQMAYMNGILFVTAPDGKTIYRSTSVCPLDFVVNVDTNGNKGGDAETTSFAVSPYEITCLQPLSSGELFVGTIERCYPIELNYNFTIFQEPTILNRHAFAGGVVGQDCFIDILGDYAFIDSDGLRSFNAISSINNEGRNSVFSLKIARLLDNTVQSTESSCVLFNNYALFSVNSTQGNVVLIYDQLTQKWVSIDNYGIGAIRQFAQTKRATNPSLYCITDRKLYKLFAGSSYLTASIYFRSNFNIDAAIELLLERVRAVFVNVAEDDTVHFTEYYNNFLGDTQTVPLRASLGSIVYPVVYPVAFKAGDLVKNVTCNWDGRAHNAFKVGAVVSWNSPAKLVMWQVEAKETTYTASLGHQIDAYAS